MKKGLKKTQREGWLTLLALVIIAIAVSIGFAPLFELVKGGTAGAFVGSSFGAIFVIILTMFLLNKQTEIEQESKKSERVFDEKVKIYQEILDICSETLKDGKLTYHEMNKLPFPVIRLQMLGGDQTISSFQKVFEVINEIYSSSDDDEVEIDEESKVRIYRMLSEFASLCRMDIGISDLEIEPKILQDTMDSITKSIKKDKDYSKFSFDGVDLPKNRYVYEVIKNYISENPGMSKKDFEEVFPRSMKELPGGRKNDFEIWKTYAEAIELHKLKGSRRYFVSGKGKSKEYLTNKDLVISLADEEICISNQWSIDSLVPFIEIMNNKSIRTK